MERRSPESSGSFHLSASAPRPPPLHRGAPGTSYLLSRTRVFLFFFLFSSRVLPVFLLEARPSPLPASQPASQRWDYPATPHKWQPPRAAVLSCRLPFQRDLGSRLRRPGMAASPVGGDVLAAEASYAQTAAASGWKGWHLLAAVLSLSSLPLSRDTARPGGGGDCKVKMAALSQQRVHLMFSQYRRRAKNN